MENLFTFRECSTYLSKNIECNDKVGHSFVGETEWCQRMPTGTFALCAIALVKLTPEQNCQLLQINGRLNIYIDSEKFKFGKCKWGIKASFSLFKNA